MRYVERLQHLRRTSLNWLAIAATGIALSLSLQGQAQAEQARKKSGDVRTVYLTKYRVNGEVRYNKGGAGKIRSISAAAYRRGTPYVCTPSGFGQQSRCYRRDFF
ncbi:hypothetical protein [Kaistia defluvii]|uniref:Uncharacterized protein n=1 Tax=Kaistia defluvii TaxID=410841 RepID=A0ABV2R4A1_9HYPH